MDAGSVFGKRPEKRIDNFGENLRKHLYRSLKCKTIVGVYDFSVQGGTVDTSFPFKCEWDESTNLVLPKGAVIIGARIWTDVAVTTGSSGEVSVGSGTTTGGTTDILEAAVVASGDLGTQYQLVSTLIGLYATSNTERKKLGAVRLEADSTPVIATTVEAITAGRIKLILQVLLP